MMENRLTEVLAEANGFKLSSLGPNRQGDLTREQIPQLYGGLVSPLVFTLVPGGFVVYQLSRNGVFSDPSLAGMITSIKELSSSLLVMGGILGLLAVWGLVMLIQTILDLTGGRVASVEDVGYRQMTRTSDEDGTTTTRLYLIGDYKFKVQQRGFSAFEDGRTYRAYFTPRRKVLVNIEAIDN